MLTSVALELLLLAAYASTVVQAIPQPVVDLIPQTTVEPGNALALTGASTVYGMVAPMTIEGTLVTETYVTGSDTMVYAVKSAPVSLHVQATVPGGATVVLTGPDGTYTRTAPSIDSTMERETVITGSQTMVYIVTSPGPEISQTALVDTTKSPLATLGGFSAPPAPPAVTSATTTAEPVADHVGGGGAKLD